MSFRHCDQIYRLFTAINNLPLEEQKKFADAAQCSPTMLDTLLYSALEYLEDPMKCDDGELCTRDHCDEHAHGNGELSIVVEKLEFKLENINELIQEMKEML